MDARGIVPAVARMISQHQHRRNTMTLPTNDDFANCELSIEELEAIAAGWPSWARAIGRGLETVAKDAAAIVIGVGVVALPVMLGYGALYTARNYNSLQVQ
jgi:hypothetical protein